MPSVFERAHPPHHHLPAAHARAGRGHLSCWSTCCRAPRRRAGPNTLTAMPVSRVGGWSAQRRWRALVGRVGRTGRKGGVATTGSSAIVVRRTGMGLPRTFWYDVNRRAGSQLWFGKVPSHTDQTVTLKRTSS